MLNNIEITILRNLENHRARVLDDQNAVVKKLQEAVEHIEQCYNDPAMTQSRFAAVVMHWHQLLANLSMESAAKSEKFVNDAADDFSPEEAEYHNPGGYIAQRLILLDAARTLAVRGHTHMEAITQVMSDWFDMAGIDMSGDTENEQR